MAEETQATETIISEGLTQEQFESVGSDIQAISINEITVPEVKLRGVNTEGEEYLELKDSIKSQGLLQNITVRPVEIAGKQGYELITGLQRYTACKELGHETIDARVKEMSEQEAWLWMIHENTQRVTQKASDITKLLKRLIAKDPTMSIPRLAKLLSKSVPQVQNYLALDKLTDEAKELVDDETIGLTNAVALAKLPPEEQEDLLADASTMTVAEFVPLVNERKEKVDQANREAREQEKNTFSPKPKARKKDDLVAELGIIMGTETGTSLLMECLNGQDVDTSNQNVKAVITQTMEWVLNLDPASVDAQRAKWEDAKKKREEREKAKAAARAEREKAKALEI